MGSIYILINKVNNKAYVGQTIYNFNTRYSGNVLKNTHNEHLKNALRKYSMKNFTLVEMKCPDELLDEREIFFIELLDAFDSGYNMTKGGQGANRKPLRTPLELIIYTSQKYVKKYANSDPFLESYLIFNIWDSFENSDHLKSVGLNRIIYSGIRKFVKNYKIENLDVCGHMDMVELSNNLALREIKGDFVTTEVQSINIRRILKNNNSRYDKDAYDKYLNKSSPSNAFRKDSFDQLEIAARNVGKLIGLDIRNMKKRNIFIRDLINEKGKKHYSKLKKMYIELKGDLELSKKMISVEIIPKKIEKPSTVIDINSDTSYINEQGEKVNLSKNKISFKDPNTYKGLILTYSELKDKYRDKFESDFWALIKTFEEIMKQTKFTTDERFILNMALNNYPIQQIIEKYSYTYKKELGKSQILDLINNIIPNKMKYTYVNKTLVLTRILEKEIHNV